MAGCFGGIFMAERYREPPESGAEDNRQVVLLATRFLQGFLEGMTGRARKVRARMDKPAPLDYFIPVHYYALRQRGSYVYATG
jgi:hypothetical protein